MNLYEDDDIRVIMDINPVSNGHMLIIPKKHYTTFLDLDNDILIKINKVAILMNNYLDKSLKPDGISLVNNYGINQMVKHYHLHIIPVYKEDLGIKEVEHIYNKIKEIV